MENVRASSSDDEAPLSDLCAADGFSLASALPPMSRSTEIGPAHGDGTPSTPMLVYFGSQQHQYHIPRATSDVQHTPFGGSLPVLSRDI